MNADKTNTLTQYNKCNSDQSGMCMCADDATSQLQLLQYKIRSPASTNIPGLMGTLAKYMFNKKSYPVYLPQSTVA